MSNSAEETADCAAALSYLLGSKVPIITASGKGLAAKRIKEVAEKYNIEIIKDSGLAHILSAQEIGSCIPPEIYGAVASIFAFLLQKNGKTD